MTPTDGQRQILFRETLGKGGFGTVYLADLKGGQGLVQRVAVKVLHSDDSELGEVSARQRDEAKLLAQLNHDHIVKVYDLVEYQGHPAVVMEYVEGVNTEAWVRMAGPLTPKAAAQVGAAVASALDAAYNARSPIEDRPMYVVHRDIKPANIMIGVTGSVKVLDFGVARADIERDAHTRTGQVGTLAFIAPEQWLHGSISPAVDIFALGLTLVRLFSGQPIDRIPLNPAKYAAGVDDLIGHTALPDATDEWRGALHDLLRAMLALDPAARPTAATVEANLLALADRAAGEGLAVLARRVVPPLVVERRRQNPATSGAMPTDLTVTHPTQSTVRSSSSSRSTSPRKQNRSWVLAGIVGGGLVLALMFAGGSLALRMLREPPPEPAPPLATLPTGPVVVTSGGLRVPTAPKAAPTPATPEPTMPVAVATPAPPAAKAAPPAKKTAATTERAAAPAAPAPSSATWPVTFSSVPMGATVYIDGKARATTPVHDLPLTEGSHTVKIVTSDGQNGQKTIRVSEHGSRQYIWTADGNSWESSI